MAQAPIGGFTQGVDHAAAGIASSGCTQPPAGGYGSQWGANPYGSVNVTWNSRVFDVNIADKPTYRYDGSTGSDADGWIKRIEEYVLGKCPDLGPWMEWAASLGRNMPITGDVLQIALQGQQMRCDLHVLNGHLWWLLGLCTTGAGKTLYRTAVPQSGLDVWRILRAFIGDRAPQRRQMLREAEDRP